MAEIQFEGFEDKVEFGVEADKLAAVGYLSRGRGKFVDGRQLIGLVDKVVFVLLEDNNILVEVDIDNQLVACFDIQLVVDIDIQLEVDIDIQLEVDFGIQLEVGIDIQLEVDFGIQLEVCFDMDWLDMVIE